MADVHKEYKTVPTVDQVDPYDRQAVLDARNQHFREHMVKWAEIGILRDKLKWCYRREGPNAKEACRELALQYIEFLKQDWFVPFSVPAPKE